MNGCVCVHGQDVLNRNPFYPMAKNDTSSSIPNGDEPSSPCRDEMFSVRSRILKTPAKNSNTSVCNGYLDNYIGEESGGVYLAKKLDEEEQRISKLCFAVQLQMWENSPPEEGMFRIGSHNLPTLKPWSNKGVDKSWQVSVCLTLMLWSNENKSSMTVDES
jgi:hypothetical protein